MCANTQHHILFANNEHNCVIQEWKQCVRASSTEYNNIFCMGYDRVHKEIHQISIIFTLHRKT